MRAWLIVNEFLTNGKFTEIHNWLLEAAKKKNITMQIFTNAQILILLNGIKEDTNDRPDFVLFWDKDIRLAWYLEQKNYRVFNSSKAIAMCDDKSMTHITLYSAGIPMPTTIVAPKTFKNIGYTNLNFLKDVEATLGYPIILKECFGSFGEQVYFINNYEELTKKVIEMGDTPIIFQEYISTSFARDLRLQVVGDEVIAAMYRYSDNGDFRANISAGGKMKSFTPTKVQKELAIKCCKVLALDFAGVDLLFGENDEPIVCEINSNAHFKNIYDCTGVNAADKIIDYILTCTEHKF